jgi:multidrug efflux pump subunit AcrA (membrane-fusion protein)
MYSKSKVNTTLGRMLLFLTVCGMTLICCRQSQESDEDESPSEIRTPVTVTSVNISPVKEYITLNATASFLQNSYVKSNINGYVKEVDVKLGDAVNKGQMLFVLKTREAEAIGNSVNDLNPDFKFSGTSRIPANSTGFIAALNHQPGDYVQDGDQLAVISDDRSFVFLMSVPYEDRDYVSVGKDVQVALPDGTNLPGKITLVMPTMDSVSQTQTYAIRVKTAHFIPQNLVATVNILKLNNPTATMLPRSAVLSNETLSTYWVMKLINDTTAVKVPVKIGTETTNQIEILSPSFSPGDKILASGNYGLPDTAFVKVQN